LAGFVWFLVTKPIFFLHSPDQLPQVLLSSLPTIPLVTALFGPFARLRAFLRPRSLQEQVDEQLSHLARHDQAVSQRALACERDLPDHRPGELRLGFFLRQSLRSAPLSQFLGIHRQGSFLSLADTVTDQHGLICGITGSGKTEALKRLAFEYLYNTERDFYFVDGKGETQLAQVLQRLCQKQRGKTPIFRLGQQQRGDPYHGFQGQPEDIYNRLCAMVGTMEAEGNAQYYADVNRDLLQLICFAPQGPPDSFEELSHRLSLDWLKLAWRRSQAELRVIDNLKKQDLKGLATRLRPLARELAPIVNPKGFILENTRSAIFSIRVQSVSDTARRFLQFLIEDFKDFAGKRQRRPGVLIIDEFAAFGCDNIVALLTLARSAKLAIILATQSTAGLGDERTKELILDNTGTKLLMLSQSPELIASLAGTTYQTESSFQHEAGTPTDLGTVRFQHSFVVDPNEVRGLQPGEAFLIRHRYAAKLRIARVFDDALPSLDGVTDTATPAPETHPEPDKSPRAKLPSLPIAPPID
jgi:Cdc6-like AAA superfamily ATPase